MSNRYGKYTPLPPERRSQMAKDAAKTRRVLHPTKDDITRGAAYLSTLSPAERARVAKSNEERLSMFSVFMCLALLSIPLAVMALLLG